MIFGLLGKSIQYSQSPRIHKALFQAQNKEADYMLFDGDHTLLHKTLMDIKHGVIHGINVTIPYKEAVMPYLDELTEEAKATQAVNTIMQKAGKLIGHNTDVGGFAYLLNHYAIDVKDKTVIILGTGGAAKAVAYAITQKGGRATMVSRQIKHACITYEDLASFPSYDIIINATPIGSVNHPGLPLDEALIKKASHAIDLIYEPAITPFVKAAKKGYNGSKMLRAQAIYAQAFWFDLPQNTIDLLLREASL